MTDYSDLADRVERATDLDRELDAEAAVALGWGRRRVGGLGVNGRTKGSYYWFRPGAAFREKGSRNPPRLSGPRKRAATAACLRALDQKEEG